MVAIGIEPIVDFAFKRLLGSREHSQITVHFLNAVLGASPRITDVTILNPFLEKDFEEDKLSVLDVLATDEHGRRLNVEMQTSLPAGIHQRLTYYAACLYVEQLTEGQDYPTLRPAISICVLDAVMFPNSPDLHLDFRLRDDGCGETLADDLQIHTVELPKYDPQRSNGNIFPWLTGLARNEIQRVIARERSSTSLEALWAKMDEELRAIFARLESEPLADEVLQREEIRVMVNATMSQLPPHYREALEAKYVDRRSVRDIATARSTSEKAVESLLTRARQAFRETFLALDRNLA